MNTRANVLVVDDEEVVRRSYAAVLASARLNAQVASNGDAGLRAMRQRAFDVVLLDMRMPGTDGMTVLKTLKQQWPESEVVVITGYPNVDSAKEAVRLGACDYLAKPVGPDDIVGATLGALTRKRWALREQPANPQSRSKS